VASPARLSLTCGSMYRECPMLTAGCRPSAAPARPRVTSLEGTVEACTRPGCYPDRAGHHTCRATAGDRGRPLGAGATGTWRARPARTNLAQAWRRWSPARPEAKPVQIDHLPRWQSSEGVAAAPDAAPTRSLTKHGLWGLIARRERPRSPGGCTYLDIHAEQDNKARHG
jgi:hypothetical protein